MEINNLTINKIHESLLKKDFSALEITKAYLEQIDKKDKAISAFLTITEDLAISQAKQVDKLISKGKNILLLAGVPFAVKDNILVEGVKCTAASKILEDYIAPYDATVVKKLKDEGAVILGKTNLDEFAMGSSTENSAFKITRNPENLERVPGGSSGGSAAAVAAGECCCALGSDTGGSIRQPASFCGVVGLKPTYGAVSRYGLIAFASSLDQIGPITKNVEDAKIVFRAISGRDPLDSTSVGIPKFENWKLKIENLKIGIPKEYFIKGIDPEVEKIVKKALEKIEKEGIKVEEISLPHTKYALACYYIIAPSEASANLARYDGVKYGYSKKEKDVGNLLDVYFQTRGDGFGSEVKRRIMLGTYSLSSGYYDAYYLKAQQIRELIKNDFKKAFEKVDLILTPTSPTPAFKIGEKTNNPLEMYLADIYTVPVNLAGLPAISLPCPVRGQGVSEEIQGKQTSNGACNKIRDLPVGLQIIGKSFEEEKIFSAAAFIEKIAHE